MSLQKPELIAPAGDWSALRSAVKAGADAVYFGIKGINMRYGAANFDILEIKKVMDFLHKKGKKGYLALNVIVYDYEIDKIRDILKIAKKTKVDAIILWDMAVLSIAKDLGLAIHISTQASIANFESLKYFSNLGAKQIVLARECTLPDIQNIIKKVKNENINCKIETFIHGAICTSISGRCFLSQISFNKSANKGECLQPCRREYEIIDTDKECNYIVGKDYLLSAKDLCTINFIDQLIESGIDSFKIEGRMRSSEYVSEITACYRKAINAYFENKLTDELKQELFKKVSVMYNRGFSSGFYFGRPDDLGGQIQKNYDKIYLGEITKFYKKLNVAEVLVRNEGLKKGDHILVSGKRTSAEFIKVSQMQREHREIDFAQKGEHIGIKLPFRAYPKDKVFIWKIVNKKNGLCS